MHKPFVNKECLKEKRHIEIMGRAKYKWETGQENKRLILASLYHE